MTDTEKATIGDVFRLVNEMRANMATKDDVAGLNERFDKVDDRLDEAAAERQAIRDVVDNDLAGQGQVMQLEGKLTDVQKTLRRHGKKIDTLTKERA